MRKLNVCLVLIKRSSRWDEEPECQKLYLFFGSVWKYMEGESWWTLLTWITKLAQKVTSDVMELFVSLLEIEAEQLINLLSH